MRPASVLAASLVACLAPATAFAWPSAFPFRRVVDVDNPDAGTLASYQLSVSFDTAAAIGDAKMNADCSDVRFTDSDGDTMLPYWIESGCGTASTHAWVRVPSVTAGGHTLYLYYGDPTAVSAANPAAVYDFYDDFPDAGLDTAKWSPVIKGTAAIRTDGGRLELEVEKTSTFSGAGVHTEGKYVFNKNNGLIAEFLVSQLHVAANGCGAGNDCGNHSFTIRAPVCTRDGNYGGPSCQSMMAFSLYRFNGNLTAAWGSPYLTWDGTTTWTGPPYSPALSYTVRVEVNPASRVRVFLDDVLRLDTTANGTTWSSVGNTSVIELYNGSYYPVGDPSVATSADIYEYFRTRKFAAAPPVATVGPENAPCFFVTCTAMDQCHTAGTCDPATGACSNPLKADATPCSDGSLCTSGETCQAGVCGGATSTVTCTALDNCHDVGTCISSTGVCSNPEKAYGVACDDGNACTSPERCEYGVCVALAVKTCTASDQCHAVGTCDSSTGLCSNPAVADGTSCSDGNGCTLAETCQGGACGNPTGAVTCSVLSQCHELGTCNPATGLCSNPPKPDGTSCDDATACTTGETCQAGSCGAATSIVTCPASDQCHAAGACDPATGVCSTAQVPDGTACNDANACTTGETCQAGSCGSPAVQVDCGAPDQCHLAGVCSPATGLCSSTPKPDGASCDDNDRCTSGERCQAGACGAPTATVTCTALTQCHEAGTCDPATGACSTPFKRDGAPCDDMNACTQLEMCVAGQCGSPIVTKECPTPRLCHERGACDPATGACSDPLAAEGAACGAGVICSEGKCVAPERPKATGGGCGCGSSGAAPSLAFLAFFVAMLARRRRAARA